MKKQKRAVIVSLEQTRDGKFKLNLDDLIQSNTDVNKWSKDVHITFKEYEHETFEELEFDEKELADFGYYIIARLHAFFKQGEI